MILHFAFIILKSTSVLCNNVTHGMKRITAPITKFVISGFCHKVDENCALLGYYTTYLHFLTDVLEQPIGPIIHHDP
jgi:hypothetical protein